MTLSNLIKFIKLIFEIENMKKKRTITFAYYYLDNLIAKKNKCDFIIYR